MISKIIQLFSSGTTLRIATLTALLAYPLGCLSFILLPKGLDAVGGGLLVLAVLGFLCTLPSYVNRVAFIPQVLGRVDQAARLDELELDLRRRAQAFAFQVFSVLILAGIMYLVIAADLVNAGEGNLWMPTVDDHWLAILFGVLFYVILLPSAYLAWRMPKPVNAEAGDQVETDCGSESVQSIYAISMTLGMATGILLFDDFFLGLAIGAIVGVAIDLIRRRRQDGGN